MRITNISALTLGALILAACDSGTDPNDPGPLTAVDLNFCATSPPTWIGFQNTGEGWQELTPNSTGLVTFVATRRVSVAIVLDFSGNTFTQVLNTTADELESATGMPCDVSTGSGTLAGTVEGLTGTQFARISAAELGTGTSATVDDPAYELTQLPSDPRDLVATRYQSEFSSPAQRVIVRRGLVPQAGVPATLDFGGAESHPLASAVMNFNNVGANASLAVNVDLHTATRTVHRLMQMTGTLATTSVGHVGLPSLVLQPTDIHELTAHASDVIGVRQVVHFYSAVANGTLSFGPHVNEAAIEAVATTPYLRMRAQMASQAEYPTAAMAEFNKVVDGAFKSVSVVTTSGFTDGRPATWDLTVPDMSAGGYESSWGLQGEAPESYGVVGFNGSAGILLGQVPANGATYMLASRSANVSADFVALQARRPQAFVRRGVAP